MAHLSPCIVKVLNSKTSLVPAAIWSGSDLHLRVMIHKIINMNSVRDDLFPVWNKAYYIVALHFAGLKSFDVI